MGVGFWATTMGLEVPTLGGSCTECKRGCTGTGEDECCGKGVKRVEKNIENIKSIKDFLTYIIENPKAALIEVPEVFEQIKTQHLLASLQNDKWNITSSSLNTLKRISPKVFDNGYDELEKLRILAVEKLEQHLKISERRDLSKDDKIKQLEQEIEKMERL